MSTVEEARRLADYLRLLANGGTFIRNTRLDDSAALLLAQAEELKKLRNLELATRKAGAFTRQQLLALDELDALRAQRGGGR